MPLIIPPRPSADWRKDQDGRQYDAAHTYGYYLIQHCRDEVLKQFADTDLPTSAEELQAMLKEAIEHSLHNVNDLLEGFFPLETGPAHAMSLALSVRVHTDDGTLCEEIPISPALMDLPIGYWGWVDGEFR